MIPGKQNGAGFLESFRHAAAGIAHASRGRNFRVQSAFGVLAVVLGLWLKISTFEWIAVIICVGVVLGGECLNTALEDIVDMVSPTFHPLAKTGKDCAAGAVLCCAIASLIVGVVIFLPKLLHVLFG
ncbi:MAG: diacylglycerol kinase family protein [Eggerthellaceae bacterium]|nr:diacylglycerol kinase family protein [Eggerthellaceae bacterium]